MVAASDDIHTEFVELGQQVARDAVAARDVLGIGDAYVNRSLGNELLKPLRKHALARRPKDVRNEENAHDIKYQLEAMIETIFGKRVLKTLYYHQE